MKKKWILAIMCLLLLCGCGESKPEEPAVTESQLWTQAPELIHGTLEYEKLEPAPWHCGRLEYTSGNTWAETELGYYYYESASSLLFYADKANLSNWVPVCGKPNCLHLRINLNCDARLDWRTFYIRDGRIHYATSSGGKNEPTYVPDMQSVPIMCSRALDGSDLQIDYVLEEALSPHGGGSYSGVFTPEHWLANVSVFNTNGTYTHKFCRVTEAGVEILAEMTTEEKELYQRHYILIDRGVFSLLDGRLAQLYPGDRQFFNELLDETTGRQARATIYRYRSGAVEAIEIDEALKDIGEYLSGNTLRLYRENDGYYDLDLTTRQETFVAPPGMADANSTIYLPNCILESNSERWLLFDGETWREIHIPEEYQDVPLRIAGIASDRIFLVHGIYPGGEAADVFLYQIRLDQQELAVEYCGQIT